MKRIVSLGLALGLAGPVFAAESTVALTSGGQELVGTLAVPDGEPAPVVLMLHGFGGSRDELKTEHVPEGVFARTASQLSEAGIASLRIDFRGSGESLADLTYADTTFAGQVADAAAAVDFLKSSDKVDGDDIHVIGWSQGGLVAATLAGKSESLDSVSLWNAVGDPKATYGAIFGAETMALGYAAATDEVIVATLPWGVDMELKGAFFDGVETHDPVAEIASYSGPLLVVQGSADTLVLPENADNYIASHEGEEKLWLSDMDHVFNTFGTAESLDAVIDETLGFIKANLD